MCLFNAVENRCCGMLSTMMGLSLNRRDPPNREPNVSTPISCLFHFLAHSPVYFPHSSSRVLDH